MLKKIWKGIKTGIKGIKKGLVKAFGEKGAMLVGALAMWFIAPQIASWFSKSGVGTSSTIVTETQAIGTNLAEKGVTASSGGTISGEVIAKDFITSSDKFLKSVDTATINKELIHETTQGFAKSLKAAGPNTPANVNAVWNSSTGTGQITGLTSTPIELTSSMTGSEAGAIYNNLAETYQTIGGPTKGLGRKITELGTRDGFLNNVGYYTLKGINKSAAVLGKVYTTPTQAIQGTAEALGAGNLATGLNNAANYGRDLVGLETSVFQPQTAKFAKKLGYVNKPSVLGQSLLSPSGTPLEKAWGGMKEVAEFGTAAGTIHTAFAGRPDLYMPGADSTQGAMYLSNTVDVTSRRSIGDPTTKQNFDNALTVSLNRSEIPSGIRDNILQSPNRISTFGKAPLYGGPRLYDSYMQAANQWTS